MAIVVTGLVCALPIMVFGLLASPSSPLYLGALGADPTAGFASGVLYLANQFIPVALFFVVIPFLLLTEFAVSVTYQVLAAAVRWAS